MRHWTTNWASNTKQLAAATVDTQTQGVLTCKQKIKWEVTLNKDGTAQAVLGYYGWGLQTYCGAPSFCREEDTDKITFTQTAYGKHENGKVTIYVNQELPVTGPYTSSSISGNGSHAYTLNPNCVTEDGVDSHKDSHSYSATRLTCKGKGVGGT